MVTDYGAGSGSVTKIQADVPSITLERSVEVDQRYDNGAVCADFSLTPPLDAVTEISVSTAALGDDEPLAPFDGSFPVWCDKHGGIELLLILMRLSTAIPISFAEFSSAPGIAWARVSITTNPMPASFIAEIRIYFGGVK